MRSFGLSVCFVIGAMVMSLASGCGDPSPPTRDTAPTEKQAMKEGKSGGMPGAAGKQK
jgi:hypothetical protein